MSGSERGIGDALQSPVERLARLSPVWRNQTLARLTRQQQIELQERWYAWAHAGQLAPPGDWRVWLIRAGRGFGKTRAGSEWVSEWARCDKHARIALVGATADDVAKVMIEGPSGVIAVARAGETVKWRASAGEVTFHSGAKGFVYSAETPEKLRGPEHHAACGTGPERDIPQRGPGCDRLFRPTRGGHDRRDHPPAVAGSGRMPIVGTNAEGNWTGADHSLACWTQGGWRFATPFEGMGVWLVGTGPVRFADGEWRIDMLIGRGVEIDGQRVIGARGDAIPIPTGGSVADIEAREAIATLIERLEAHGLIAPSVE